MAKMENCSVCNGSGTNPATGNTCAHCGGSGKVIRR